MRSTLQPYVVQAIRLLYDAMPAPLWLRPYHILSTGPRSGLIEMVSSPWLGIGLELGFARPGEHAHADRGEVAPCWRVEQQRERVRPQLQLERLRSLIVGLLLGLGLGLA